MPTANGGFLQNTTVYRVTPRNVTDLCNKDTADTAGDYAFYMAVCVLMYGNTSMHFGAQIYNTHERSHMYAIAILMLTQMRA